MPSAWEHPSLSPQQRARLGELYPDASIAADHSWPFGITVLEFHAGEAHLLLKASATSHHLEREYRAHTRWLASLAGDVPVLVAYDRAAGLLVKTFLPGRLVLGSPAEHDPAVFQQAGTLLGRLHRGLAPIRAPHYEESMARKTHAWLGRAGGLAPAAQLRAAADWLEAFRPSPVELVPTHGDYQPRNWLVRPDGRLAVIDFGRAELRPWYSDLVRMQHGDFATRPGLRAAFMDGYGPGPTPDSGSADDAGRRLDALMQAVGTIVWSQGMGDAAFEEHGRTMLARILADS
ncbi:aminoglycoside phosphotransferase family protein [Arthrobacter sp. JSM 101049]|uniref:aminoglycoside phosphotransferase family protein n=1 Tax=Arthrobacter sp. JSM 101049 TaxID=929097 RepID=UPI003561B697